MTLKELKQKLDAAAAELAKKPEDAALVAAQQEAKTAYDAALAAAQSEDDAEDDGKDGKGDKGELDVSKLDPKVQKLIKDLRKENGDARKRNKTLDESHSKLKKSLIEAGIIENDEEDPQEKLKNVTAMNDGLAFNSAVLEAAVEHGVGKADLKYFRFLVQEKVAELKDGEEIDADAMAELAKASRRTASSNGSTSVDGKGGGEGGTAPKPGASGDVTLEQFCKMNMGEKSALYLKNAALYNGLMAEAKSKKMLLVRA
jgi:hypothetical protein